MKKTNIDRGSRIQKETSYFLFEEISAALGNKIISI